MALIGLRVRGTQTSTQMPGFKSSSVQAVRLAVRGEDLGRGPCCWPRSRVPGGTVAAPASETAPTAGPAPLPRVSDWKKVPPPHPAGPAAELGPWALRTVEAARVDGCPGLFLGVAVLNGECKTRVGDNALVPMDTGERHHQD